MSQNTLYVPGTGSWAMSPEATTMSGVFAAQAALRTAPKDANGFTSFFTTVVSSNK